MSAHFLDCVLRLKALVGRHLPIGVRADQTTSLSFDFT